MSLQVPSPRALTRGRICRPVPSDGPGKEVTGMESILWEGTLGGGVLVRLTSGLNLEPTCSTRCRSDRLAAPSGLGQSTGAEKEKVSR